MVRLYMGRLLLQGGHIQMLVMKDEILIPISMGQKMFLYKTVFSECVSRPDSNFSQSSHLTNKEGLGSVTTLKSSHHISQPS